VTAHPRPVPYAPTDEAMAALYLNNAARCLDIHESFFVPGTAHKPMCRTQALMALEKAAQHLGLAVIPLTNPDAARHAIRRHAADLGLICYEAEQQEPYLGRFGEAG
jgi:hypothetical protein